MIMHEAVLVVWQNMLNYLVERVVIFAICLGMFSET